jgi:DNA repair protein RadC
MAEGIIISHNHPSGNTKPSEQDIQITKKIKDICKLFDMSLLDHLILTDETYLSMADEGLM